MAEMSNKEVRKFLMKGTFSGKLGTIKKDGSTLVVPNWYILDERNSINKTGNIYFTNTSDQQKPKIFNAILGRVFALTIRLLLILSY